MSNTEAEIVQYGFEVIVEAFEKQKKRLKTQISQLQKIISGLLQENTNLKKEIEKYYNENLKLKIDYQEIYSTFEKNQAKLYTIQSSILKDNRSRERNEINNVINIDNDNNYSQITTEPIIIHKQVFPRSLSLPYMERKYNYKTDSNKEKGNFTKEFLSQCKNELDPEVYKQILFLFQKYQEGKLKDIDVIKQIHIFLNGNTKLLKLFDHLVD